MHFVCFHLLLLTSIAQSFWQRCSPRAFQNHEPIISASGFFENDFRVFAEVFMSDSHLFAVSYFA